MNNWLVDDTVWKVIEDNDPEFMCFDWLVNTDNWTVYINTGEIEENE